MRFSRQSQKNVRRLYFKRIYQFLKKIILDRFKFIKLHLAIGLTECKAAKSYSIDLPEDVDIDQETYEVLLVNNNTFFVELG